MTGAEHGDGAPTPRSRYRHRGPRRATGGTTTSQGEPEHLAGFGPAGSEGGTASPAEGSGSAGEQRAGRPDGSTRKPGSETSSAPEDARGRWLLEQRPPHWG